MSWRLRGARRDLAVAAACLAVVLLEVGPIEPPRCARCGQDPGGVVEVLDGRRPPSRGRYSPNRAVARARGALRRQCRARAIVMVASIVRAHGRPMVATRWRRPGSRRRAVELGGDRRVALDHVGMVETRDGDAHEAILAGADWCRRLSRRLRHGRWGADELPAGLPAPAVGDIQRDVEEGEALELTGAGQRPDVDGIESDRSQRESRTICCGLGIIGGDVAVELDSFGDRVALVPGEQGVERLHDREPGGARQGPRRWSCSCPCRARRL